MISEQRDMESRRRTRRKSNSPRVRWDFLEAALRCLRFLEMIIKLLMECVSGAKFSVLVNGAAEGFFKGTRGLRQGCPLSPYLFALIMEFFSIMMTQYASTNMIDSISFCEKGCYYISFDVC